MLPTRLPSGRTDCNTRDRSIGCLRQTISCSKKSVELYSLATPLLAPMIEEGFVNNAISHSVLETYLSDPHLNNIDALLLACTHYPLIRQEITDFFKNKMPVLDSTDVTAAALKTALAEQNLLSDQKQAAISSMYPIFLKIFFGQPNCSIRKK